MGRGSDITRKAGVTVDNRSVSGSTTELEDDKLLEDIGYKPSFKREFSNLATVRFLWCLQLSQALSWTGFID